MFFSHFENVSVYDRKKADANYNYHEAVRL